MSNIGEVQDRKNISEGKDITMKVHAFDVEEHIAIEDVILEQKSEISDRCKQDPLENVEHIRNSKHNINYRQTNIIVNNNLLDYNKGKLKKETQGIYY